MRSKVMTAVGVAVIVAAILVIWVYCVQIVPRSDFRVFLQAGDDIVNGRNPYPALDSEFLYSGSAFVYPIAAALLVSPIVWSHYFVLLLAPLLAARVAWPWLAGFAVVSWMVAPPPEIGEVQHWINRIGEVVPQLYIAQAMVLAVVVVCGVSAGGRTRVSTGLAVRAEAPSQ